MSTISSARSPRRDMAASISPRSRSTSDAPVEASSTSRLDQVVEHAVERRSPGRRRAPPSSAPRSGERLATMMSLDAGAVERDRHGGADVAGADHEHAAAFEPAEPLAGHGDGRRRHRHRVAADARSRSGRACRPRSPGGRRATASGPIIDSCSATRHASRTWPRISPSPTIIESTPAATPNRCATAASSWYVYRWSLIVSGSSDDWSVRKLRTSSTAGWKRVRARRPRCGCTSRAPRPRRGSRCAPACAAPWAARATARPSARAARPGSCGGSGH